MVIEITLMRHGRSRADDEGVHEGRYDSPLTDIGRSQVRRRADAWARDGVSFHEIVCGPLVRAVESAEIVATVLGSTVRSDPDWSETDNGQLAGLTFADAEARFPARTFDTPYDRIGLTGETGVELHARASTAMQEIALSRESPVLIVAHGGIINAALRSVLGMPLPIAGSGASFAFGDAGFIRLSYDPERHVWRVLAVRAG